VCPKQFTHPIHPLGAGAFARRVPGDHLIKLLHLQLLSAYRPVFSQWATSVPTMWWAVRKGMLWYQILRPDWWHPGSPRRIQSARLFSLTNSAELTMAVAMVRQLADHVHRAAEGRCLLVLLRCRGIVSRWQAIEDGEQGEEVAVDVAAAAADQLEHVRGRFLGIMEELVVYLSAILRKEIRLVDVE